MRWTNTYVVLRDFRWRGRDVHRSGSKLRQTPTALLVLPLEPLFQRTPHMRQACPSRALGRKPTSKLPVIISHLWKLQSMLSGPSINVARAHNPNFWSISRKGMPFKPGRSYNRQSRGIVTRCDVPLGEICKVVSLASEPLRMIYLCTIQ